MTEMDDLTDSRGDSNVFDLTRRGYDRRQVDDHVQSLLIQLAETEQARQRAEGRATRAEVELTRTQERLRDHVAAGETQRLRVVPSAEPASPETDPDDGSWPHAGFGLRVEKLLRAAEQEAVRTRQSATREAHALLEQARADAEVHRHEVEQALIAHTTEIDQKAARRKVELDERERHIGEQDAVAQQEAEHLVAEAQRRAEEIEAYARDEAEELLARVEEEIAERESASEAELRRLARMRDGVRGDLGRLMQSLAGEFDRRSGDASPPSASRRAAAEPAAHETLALEAETPYVVYDQPAHEQDAPGHDAPAHALDPSERDAYEPAPFPAGDEVEDDRDDDLDDGDSGTLPLRSAAPPGWFGRTRAVAEVGSRPPPGPGHLRRTGHGGYGRADLDESRSRWFDGLGETDDPGQVDDPVAAEPGRSGSAHVDLRPAGATGPAGLPGAVSPVGSMSLAGPVGRYRLSGPIGGIGPVGPMPGR